MTSASERHGLHHYSASSCNLFQADPALFVMEKLLGMKSNVGAAAHRGTASEHGVTIGLINPDASVKSCQDAAVKEFDRLTALSPDPNRDKERDAVPGIVETALAELRQYGKPSLVQQRIEWKHDDLPLPFVGFSDFVWEDHGIIVDLKSQLRLSSEISTNHARQVALYGAALTDNVDLRITYSTPKKCATYRVENAREHLIALVKIAQTIERFLGVSDDPKELAGIVVPNVDSFYFSDPRTRQNAFEVYGI